MSKNKKKTPISLLIEALKEELENGPKELWPGLEYSIEIAKTFGKLEKKIMCQFAEDWHVTQLEMDDLYRYSSNEE